MKREIKNYDYATGVELTPGLHGEKCKGNGEHPGVECCCDECDFYLLCYPDWDVHLADQ